MDDSLEDENCQTFSALNLIPNWLPAWLYDAQKYIHRLQFHQFIFNLEIYEYKLVFV